MILSVSKLKSALQIIAPAFRSPKHMPILEFVTIETDGKNVKLTGSDLRETIIHNYVDEENNKEEVILIEYQPFINYIKLNNNVFVELEPELKSKVSNIIHIKSGSAKVKLPGENPENRIQTEVNDIEKEFNLDASLFTEAYKRCLPFALKADYGAMAGVRFLSKEGKLTMEGCQTSNLARLNVDCDVDFEFILDRSIKSVSDLFQNGNVDVKISSNKIEISNESTCFIGLLIEESFPETDNVINNLKDPQISKVNRVDLLNELKRAEQFASTGKSFVLTFKPKKIGITAEFQELDMFYENYIEAESFTDFSTKTMIDVFIKAVSLCEGDKVEVLHYSEIYKPVIVRDTDTDYFALIMPMK